jgi:hypothetical protein
MKNVPAKSWPEWANPADYEPESQLLAEREKAGCCVCGTHEGDISWGMDYSGPAPGIFSSILGGACKPCAEKTLRNF